MTVPVVPVPTRMTLGRVAELLASPGLALFAQPRLLAELDQVKASGLSGCVLDETECPMRPAGSATATLPQPEIRLVAASGECECAHDVRRDAAGGWSADAPRSGPSSGGPRHYAISDDRLLLRIQAPESAVPSVNSALQLDALRVLESSTAGGIDWLVSLDEEEEEEVVERLECGVQGEAFRRGERRSVLRISRVPAGPGTALVLPEACRVGVCTPGALPRGTEVLWRAGLGARSATPLERCIAPRPFWVTAGRAADACLVARSLPRGAAWAAHLRASPLPTPSELESLLEAGCGGVAVRWEHGGRRLSCLLSRNVS